MNIIFRFFKNISQLFFFFKRKILPGFYIDKKSLVIDIGSGDKPFWRADVFCDNLSLGDNQRYSRSKIVRNLGLFFNGDISNMSFKDHTFDFSFCSHMLEHVEDPEAALREIMRISKSGYIEVPNAIVESIKPFHSHLWSIYCVKDQLVFVRKSSAMHNIILENGKRYRYLDHLIINPFIRLYWKDKINYRIINELGDESVFQGDGSPEHSEMRKNNINWYLILIKIIRFFFYVKKEIKSEDLTR